MLLDAVSAGDLPAIIKRLRNESNTIVPTAFFPANCDERSCQVADGRAPPLGAVVSGGPERLKNTLLCAPETAVEHTFQGSKDALFSNVSLEVVSDTIDRLLESDRKAAEIVRFLASSARLEAQQPHTELVLGEAELKRSWFSLAAACRNAAPASAKFITERLFGKLVLTVTLKPTIEFQTLKAKLLELQDLLSDHYKTGIAANDQTRFLRIESKDFRLALIRTATVDILRKEHSDWFQRGR